MHIRPEETNDIEAIGQITQDAFASAETNGQTEAAIIDALRKAGALTISLVAIENNKVVGHVAISPITIEGENEGWYGLGPLSVKLSHRNQGVGGKLIHEGLNTLTNNGAAGCVVVGEPDYYKRFGFVNDEKLHYEGVPGEYFMRLVIKGHTPTGSVAYHRSFHDQS